MDARCWGVAEAIWLEQLTSPLLFAMVAVQSTSSFAAPAFLAPFAQFLPFGVAPDAAAIEEREAKAQELVASRAQAAQEFVAQQHATQKSLATLESERKQAWVVASLSAQRDQKLMALEQSYKQQKMALEQERARTVAGLEQTALALGAQAEQARMAAELQSKVTGMQMPTPGLNTKAVAEQKERSADFVAKRAEQALERLTAQYEAQKQLITLEAQRAIDLATSQLTAQRKQGVMALDQRLQQQTASMDEQKFMATSQLRSVAQAAHKGGDSGDSCSMWPRARPEGGSGQGDTRSQGRIRQRSDARRLPLCVRAGRQVARESCLRRVCAQADGVVDVGPG